MRRYHHHDGHGRGAHRGGTRGGGPRGVGGAQGPATRAGRVLDREELKLLLLFFLRDGELHGYEFIREMKSRSSGAYAPSPGMVYPALGELADDGLITRISEKAGRKSFVLADSGRAKVMEQTDAVEALLMRLADLSRTKMQRHAPVERALANLDLVLATATEDADFDRIDRIVALIDTVARDIERLD